MFVSVKFSHKEVEVKKKTKKWCPKCEQFHALEKFSINRGRKDGLAGWCKKAIAENNRKLLEENKAKWEANDPYEGSK